MEIEDLYTELIRTISKEQLSEIIKVYIRQNFPEALATFYCQQFDEAKKLADFLELYAKYVRGNK